MLGTDATIHRYTVILTLTSLINSFRIYMSARFYDDLFSDIMTLYVELDFCQNFIWYACRTVETKEASRKCYNFSLISDLPRDPNCVELEPFKILTQPWLYGPATDRTSTGTDKMRITIQRYMNS